MLPCAKKCPRACLMLGKKDCSPAGLHSLFIPREEETGGTACCSSHLPPLLALEEMPWGRSGVLIRMAMSPSIPTAVLLTSRPAPIYFKLPTRTEFWVPLTWLKLKSCVKVKPPSFSPIPSGIRKLLPWALTRHRLRLEGGPVPLGRCQSPPDPQLLSCLDRPRPSLKFPLLLLSDAKAPPWGRRNSSCLILCGARRGARRDSA